MKILYASVALVLAVLTAGYLYLETRKTPVPVVSILNFEDCVKSGYIVLETYPRQCKTPDGKTFAEEIHQTITYNNATSQMIEVELPAPGAVTGKDFSIIGKAKGTWYFEASFPVSVLDKDGNVLFEGPAKAMGDWMTESMVPFKIEVKIPQSYIGPAKVVLKRDNPSGLTENDSSISFPINIEY